MLEIPCLYSEDRFEVGCGDVGGCERFVKTYQLEISDRCVHTWQLDDSKKKMMFPKIVVSPNHPF